MTDDTNTIREALHTLYAYTSDAANPPGAGRSATHSEARAALARVEARLAAPCHCDKCLDCLAADGYETAIERAEQAERERDALLAELESENYILSATHAAIVGRLSAEADRLREALRDALDCKGSFNGTVSERGGGPAICTKCEGVARAALAGPQAEEGEA